MSSEESNAGVNAKSQVVWRSWQAFWFGEGSPHSLRFTKLLFGLLATAWWASFWSECDFWFGEAGALDATVAASLIEFEETPKWQHWSPLWLLDSPLAIRLYLVLGMLTSLLVTATAIGKMKVTVEIVATCLLLLLTIGWTHRIVWLQSPAEPVLIAGSGYLCTAAFLRDRWGCGNYLVRRLFQVHWWMLVAIGLASQLASLNWWRGEAAWWLASEANSNLLTIELLSGKTLTINAITHGFILIQIAALALMLHAGFRSAGLVFAVLVGLGYGLIGNQLIYGLLLIAFASAYLPPRSQ